MTAWLLACIPCSMTLNGWCDRMALHSLKVAPKSAEAHEMREPEGIEVHVSHEHLKKLGIDTPPPAGTKVALEARGHVSESHTSQVDGKTRHHMRITLTRGDLKPSSEPDSKRADVRGDVEAAADAVAKKAR